MTIIICKVNSGMCNRLIPYITGYRLAVKLKCSYFLYWNNECSDMDYSYEGKPTEYNDMFETIKDINYINDEKLNNLLNSESNILKIDYMQTDLYKYSLQDFKNYDIILFNNYVHPIYTKEDNVQINNYSDIMWILKKSDYYKDVQYYFELLKPISLIQNKINEVLQFYPKDCNNIIGFHVRHWPTKWVNKNKNLIDGNYEKRIELMENYIAQNNDIKFYICSSDKNAINDFYNKFGERIIYFENRLGNKDDDKYYTNNENISKGNIYKNLNGVIDLFLLSKCNTIIGDVGSSYSLCAPLLNSNSTYKQIKIIN